MIDAPGTLSSEEAMRTQSRITPYGGRLVNLLVAPGTRPAFEERARSLPRLVLNAREFGGKDNMPWMKIGWPV
jgi:hypothetical protein